MKPEPLLEVENLAVALDGKTIIEHVSFSLEPQQVLAVIGPNGSGKTVLLKTLVGIIKPAHGEIRWRPGTRVGYLPQRFQVDRYLPMTVEEFLNLKSPPRGAIHRTIAATGMGEKWLRRDLAHLSSGELQKVLLAWALLDEPQILLFDEPTENVDMVGQESIYKLLHHLQDTMHVTLIIVSHDLHVVYRYADHVLCLNKQMVCYGEPDEELTSGTLAKLYGDHAYFHHHHFEKP
ncbi:MAG: metal ABC transporter ATP-binding protein [Candidatus Jorgensenbacteria bacterium]